MTEKLYYLSTAKYENQILFYIEISDKELSEFFSLEDDKTYFERRKTETTEITHNVINRYIKRYSNKNRIIVHKIVKKTEFIKFLRLHFTYELKFYR